MRTFLLLLLAALMRDVMLAMFSASCFARWGFTCMSSAMVSASMQCRAGKKFTTSVMPDLSALRIQHSLGIMSYATND
jgi:hypothetical protein